MGEAGGTEGYGSRGKGLELREACRVLWIENQKSVEGGLQSDLYTYVHTLLCHAHMYSARKVYK